jgi:predicted metalloprotease
MKLLSVFAFAVLPVAAIACGPVASESSFTESTPTADLPAEQPATAEAAPDPTATPIPDAEPVSLEGAFSYNQMPQYLDAITPMIAQHFREQYADIPDPSLSYIASGQATRSPCGPLYSDAYAYCAGSQTIYVGQDLLWAFYREAGDAAPAIALAHEWGHHVQYYRGVPYGRTAAESVDFENQADCLSGAWALYADEQGWLETEDDLADVETLMQFIGSAESSSRDHGTTEERADAFESAYEDGAQACNAFFPDDPVS